MSEGALQRRLTAWWIFVGGLAVLNFGGRAAADEEPTHDAFYRYDTAAFTLVFYAFILGITLAIGTALGARRAFALYRPASWRRAGLIALGAFVAMWLAAGILDSIFNASEEQGLDPPRITADDVPPFLVNVILIAVLVPIIEELLFRGVGYTLLEQFGTWAAIVLTAIMFALVHGFVEGIPVFFAIGVGLAFVRSRTGSIYPCMIMHGAFNGIQAILGAFL
jgi:membrane protease YdiL (CAAX protease family)